MDSAVIAAILALVGTCVGSFGGIMAANKLTVYRIEQLEKKVDKHNGVIERVFKIEQHNAVVDEEIKVANHRIEDLEHFHK